MVFALHYGTYSSAYRFARAPTCNHYIHVHERARRGCFSGRHSQQNTHTCNTCDVNGARAHVQTSAAAVLNINMCKGNSFSSEIARARSSTRQSWHVCERIGIEWELNISRRITHIIHYILMCWHLSETPQTITEIRASYKYTHFKWHSAGPVSMKVISRMWGQTLKTRHFVEEPASACVTHAQSGCGMVLRDNLFWCHSVAPPARLVLLFYWSAVRLTHKTTPAPPASIRSTEARLSNAKASGGWFAHTQWRSQDFAEGGGGGGRILRQQNYIYEMSYYKFVMIHNNKLAYVNV